MKTKYDLVKNWILKAENDLKSVEHELTFDDAVTETICFHCQQTAEKYLKAYLIYLASISMRSSSPNKLGSV